MTEREKIRTEKGAEHVGMYDAPNQSTPRTTTTTNTTNDATSVLTEKRTDLIRWGPVLAGIFAALATLITLSVLGLAIGLSSFNYGDSASSFGLGAGIWGAISALLSFGVGGWLAGRAASYSGTTSGILNGAMVWFVAIPLLIYALGSGIGALARTAGGVASTAAQVAGSTAGTAANAVANNPALQATAQAAANDPALQATAAAGAASIQQSVQATAQALQNQAPTIVNQAADTGGRAAWGTLLTLGLAAAAAIAGGYLGSQTRDPVVGRTARA